MRVLLLLTVLTLGADWPRFRGVNGSANSPDPAPLPETIDLAKTLLWQTPLPAGHGGPIVVGDRIFIAAVRDRTMLTIALDRSTGKQLWERGYEAKTVEKFHQVGTAAQSTPTADADVVVTFFGSLGLYAHDHAGKLLWHKPFGPFKNDFGAGASPILVGDRVFLHQDHDIGSFLAAFDKRTGRELWKVERTEFPRGYSTPLIWTVAGKPQLVVVGTLRAIGYDPANGKEIWTVRGLARIINMSPTIGPDNVLFIPAWSPGGENGARIDVPTWAETLKANDQNGNGTLEPSEAPEGPIKMRFSQIDLDKDGHISMAEYETMRRVFTEADNVLVALKPGGTGELPATQVLWKQAKQLPYVPSPVIVGETLFMVRNGGILTSVETKTGKILKSERVFGGANYYASPVAGDGKIFLISQKGDVSVVSATAEWKLLSKGRLGEEVFATPALVGGRVYIRTATKLLCFGVAK